MTNIYPHWDILSLLIYLLLGIIGALSLYRVKKREIITGVKQSLLSRPYVIWWIIWVIAATFRYVAPNIGGSDAITYKKYFEICLNDNIPSYFKHYDILYQLFTKAIRIFTSNYHIFFMIFYGILAYSYILFLNELCPKKTNYIPFILVFYIFLRGFNTFRTNLAVACILIGIVLVYKNHKVFGALMMFLSFFLQKASIIYALLFVFYEFYKSGKITLKKCMVLTIIATILARIVQNFLINDWGENLNGAYSSYASRSLSNGFFDTFWKIAIGQLLLLFAVIFLNKIIKKDILESNSERKEQLNTIWIICLFDFITIPMTYILGIWRGYEYLYIPRLIMWSEIIYVLKQHSSAQMKKIIDLVALVAIISWMALKIYTTWDISCLMPYIFEPLIS